MEIIHSQLSSRGDIYSNIASVESNSLLYVAPLPCMLENTLSHRMFFLMMDGSHMISHFTLDTLSCHIFFR